MSSKVAFIYTGQLRSWRQCIPTWRGFYSKYNPDVYLFINDKEVSYDDIANVFGPDANIKLVHYWSEHELEEYNADFENNFEKVKRFVNEHKKEWTQSVNECNNNADKNKMYPFQFYQMEKIFGMIDFTSYDIVFKSRFDVTPKNKVILDKPWNDVHRIFPHMPSITSSDTYDRTGRCQSYLNTSEGTTLGGAYVINQEHEINPIDPERVVWLGNDHIYFGSGVNMDRLHKQIYSKYGSYLGTDVPFSWAPEAVLILHAKACGLQPIMAVNCTNVIR